MPLSKREPGRIYYVLAGKTVIQNRESRGVQSLCPWPDRGGKGNRLLSGQDLKISRIRGSL